MKILRFLQKPRWQSKDPAQRRVGVEHDEHPELLASLASIARQDEAAVVRLAALRRLADPGIAQGMAHDDPDPDVRDAARRLWRDLLCGNHAKAPELAERLRLVRVQDEPALIEHIAAEAREPELRRAALARVERPSVLAERSLADPELDIRLAALARIEDEAALERIAERARRTDKHINRAARERIEALRRARGDHALLNRQARELCEQLEALLRDPAGEEAEAAVAGQWQALGEHVEPALQQRFAAALRLLEASRDAASAPVIEHDSSPAEPPAKRETAGASEAETGPPAPAAPAEEVVAPLLAQVRFDAALDEARLKREQEQARKRAVLEALQARIDAFTQAVEAGQVSEAEAAHRQVEDTRKELGAPLPPPLQQRLSAAAPEFARLRRWQQWASREQAERLCAEIEALPTAGLHPDAVASRVREAQSEWSRLATGTGLGGLGRRFHSACRAALEPAREYFDKRSALQAAHAAKLEQLLERHAAEPESPASRGTVSAARRELATALRSLDQVAPRERRAIADRLRARLAAFDAWLQQHDAGVEQARSRLIAEAEALAAADALPPDLAAAARELQTRWQALGAGRRRTDQAQWKTFRAALDAAFGRLHAARDARAAEQRARDEAAETLCRELEATAASANPDRAEAARLRTALDAHGRLPDEVARRAREAAQRIDRHFEGQARQARLQRFHDWRAAYRHCREVERDQSPPGGDLAGLGAQALAGPALAARLAAAAAGRPHAPAEPDALLPPVLEAELLAGIEGGEDEGRRRALQVERLAAHLRGEAKSDEDELAALLERWSALGPAPAGLEQRFVAAFEGALARLQ